MIKIILKKLYYTKNKNKVEKEAQIIFQVLIRIYFCHCAPPSSLTCTLDASWIIFQAPISESLLPSLIFTTLPPLAAPCPFRNSSILGNRSRPALPNCHREREREVLRQWSIIHYLFYYAAIQSGGSFCNGDQKKR